MVDVQRELGELGGEFIITAFRADRVSAVSIRADVEIAAVDDVQTAVHGEAVHIEPALLRAHEDFQEVLRAGRVEAGIQRIQGDRRAAARAELQATRDAQTLLLIGQTAIARDPRMVDQGAGIDAGTVRTSRASRTVHRVEVAIIPAHGREAFLDDRAIGVGHGEIGTEGLVVIGPGDQAGDPRARFLGQAVIAQLRGDGGGQTRIIVESAGREQVHRGPQRAFIHGSGGRLGDADLVEEIGRESVEVETPAAVGTAGRIRTTRGGEGFHAVDADPGEVGAQTTDRDLAAFTGHAIDRDARNALDRFRQVQVRECGDVFGDNRVNHTIGIALHVQGCSQRLAVAGHGHNVFGFLGLGRAAHDRPQGQARHRATRQKTHFACRRLEVTHYVLPACGRFPVRVSVPIPADRFSVTYDTGSIFASELPLRFGVTTHKDDASSMDAAHTAQQ